MNHGDGGGDVQAQMDVVFFSGRAASMLWALPRIGASWGSGSGGWVACSFLKVLNRGLPGGSARGYLA